MRALNYGLLMCFANSLLYSCAKKEDANSELTSISQVVSTESDLPLCIADNTSEVYYVQTENKFVVCNGSKFVEVKGEKGDSGTKGETGSKGETGATGAAGSPANSGVWLYDGSGKAIGVMVDIAQGLVLFTNGGMTRVNLKTGAHNEPFAVSDTGSLTPALCSYIQANCAGTCYQNTTLSNAERPIKGSVYKSGSSYLVATGTEVAQALVVKSYESGGTCANIADAPDQVFPITTPYSFPNGITLPLVTPLSFGFKTEN